MANDKDIKKIRSLIEAFLDGTTTDTQERELYAFFETAGTLPADLEQYRGMFAWYAGLPSDSSDGSMQKKRNRRKFWFTAMSGLAATVAILVAVAIFTMPGNNGTDEFYAAYQGSYVIRGGQRITDLKTIYPELMRAERLVDSLAAVNHTTAANFRYDEDIERHVLENAIAHIDDPQLAQMIRQDLIGD